MIETLPIFKIGSHVEKGGHVVTIDEAFVKTFLEEFHTAYGDKPYRPPLTKEHERNGLSYGRVLSVHADKEWVYADVEYLEDVWELRQKGYISNFSPSFGYTTDAHGPGKEYFNLLAHLSFVTEPRQKNLEIPRLYEESLFKESLFKESLYEESPFHFNQLSYGDVIMTDQENTPQEEVLLEEEEEEKKDPVEDLVKRLEALETQFKEWAQENTPQEEEEEEGEEPNEYSEEVHLLQTQLITYKEREIKEALGSDITEPEVKALIHLSDNEPEAYQSLLTRMAQKASVTQTAPKGRVGSPKAPLTLSEASKEAGAKGLRGAAKIDYLQKLGVLK